MIKAKAGDLIVLGLSDLNLQKLKEGMPIKFNLSEMGLPPMDVLIFHGKDEDEMHLQLIPFLDPEKTIFHYPNSKT